MILTLPLLKYFIVFEEQATRLVALSLLNPLHSGLEHIFCFTSLFTELPLILTMIIQ